MKFYTEISNGGVNASADNNNENTINSLNMLKQQQQYYMQQQQQHQQQQYHDMSSFETIKRVLFNNDATSNVNGSNFSGVGGGSSTIGANSTSMNINTAKIYQNGGRSASNLEQQSQNQSGKPGGGGGGGEQQQIETSLEIITEFKQKPFDELKKKLVRTNQLYLNADKYQQVIEFISKEHTTNSQSASVNGTATTAAVANASLNGQLNGSNGNLNNSSLSLSNTSQQSTSMASGVSAKDNYQQKVFPLNDIEFPQLFMY